MSCCRICRSAACSSASAAAWRSSKASRDLGGEEIEPLSSSWVSSLRLSLVQKSEIAADRPIPLPTPSPPPWGTVSADTVASAAAAAAGVEAPAGGKRSWRSSCSWFCLRFLIECSSAGRLPPLLSFSLWSGRASWLAAAATHISCSSPRSRSISATRRRSRASSGGASSIRIGSAAGNASARAAPSRLGCDLTDTTLGDCALAVRGTTLLGLCCRVMPPPDGNSIGVGPVGAPTVGTEACRRTAPPAGRTV
mmetsp:Transcript_58080/g.189090  ORF Transcript_58080/g.189090 Transcript_58080/m.189090 type:complete len:252 (+) Transcript_58080:1307-2062(+)